MTVLLTFMGVVGPKARSTAAQIKHRTKSAVSKLQARVCVEWQSAVVLSWVGPKILAEPFVPFKYPQGLDNFSQSYNDLGQHQDLWHVVTTCPGSTGSEGGPSATCKIPSNEFCANPCFWEQNLACHATAAQMSAAFPYAYAARPAPSIAISALLWTVC